MNRIAPAPSKIPMKSAVATSKHSQSFANRTRRLAPSQDDLAYATFAPIHYEKRYAYPLLVWLHGDAGSERELRHVIPQGSMRNYVAVAPRGSRQSCQNRRFFDWRQSPEAIEAAESHIAGCIAMAQDRFNFHPNRIFIVGRDTGGTMALRAAWNEPGRFAGVGALHGPLPSQLSPMRRVNEVRKLPCLLTTSRESVLYPQNRVCDDLRLLHSAGCKVTLRHSPGDDDLTDTMLPDLNNWLMELVCGN